MKGTPHNLEWLIVIRTLFRQLACANCAYVYGSLALVSM